MPAGKEQKPKVPTKVGSGKFDIQKKLGAGCFGEVFSGKVNATGEEVAVKFEARDASAPQLEQEANILKQLHADSRPQGFAFCHHFGEESGWNCLVMEFLGKNLEDRLQGCENQKFEPLTTGLIAQQALVRIEFLHSKGLVHRDIKPENFMFGVREKQHHLYLIDFGLSKRYFDKSHHVMRQNLSLTGTARYASISAHKGFEQSRRDDLEAISYMLMYFLRGALPWSGLQAKSKEEKYRKIMEKKQNTNLDELCANHPPQFKDFILICRGLQFKERPDYQKIADTFAEVRTGEAKDHDYQWEKENWSNKDGKKVKWQDSLAALDWPQQNSRPRQPDDEEDKGQKVAKVRSGCGCFGSGSKGKVAASDD